MRYLLLPFLLLLAACGTTALSDADEAKEICRDLGLEGAAYARCLVRREHEAACRRFINSSGYTAAEARARKCE
jgi:hypothetical protein